LICRGVEILLHKIITVEMGNRQPLTMLSAVTSESDLVLELLAFAHVSVSYNSLHLIFQITVSHDDRWWRLLLPVPSYVGFQE
jgi:hypothetical protein